MGNMACGGAQSPNEVNKTSTHSGGDKMIERVKIFKAGAMEHLVVSSGAVTTKDWAKQENVLRIEQPDFSLLEKRIIKYKRMKNKQTCDKW